MKNARLALIYSWRRPFFSTISRKAQETAEELYKEE